MSLWIRVNKWCVTRFLIFKIWKPLTNFVLSNLESLRYVLKRKDALLDIRRIREQLLFITDLPFWYEQRKFDWHSDPAGGWIDFVSKPWVSVARNHGDCDDMMAIAEFVLKPHIEKGYRAHIYNVLGRGHAIYVVKINNEWAMASNQQVRQGFDSPQQAAMSYFGKNTGFMYIHGVGAYFPEAV